MSDTEQEPTFTIVDRRRRVDAEPPPAAAQAVGSTPAPSAEPPPRQERSRGLDRGGEASQAPPGGPPQPNLAAIFIMLYSDALVNLGQLPDPGTGEPHRDLDRARFTIDLLAVLRDKTEGNRTAEESAVLEEILATLQMAYVRASRQ